MLHDIISKAIGEDDPSWREFEGDIITQTTAVLTGMKAIGYNEAKAEMRAKIPQVVEEVIGIIKDILKREKEAKADSIIIEEIEYIIKSLTVENSAQKEDKRV